MAYRREIGRGQGQGARGEGQGADEVHFETCTRKQRIGHGYPEAESGHRFVAGLASQERQAVFSAKQAQIPTPVVGLSDDHSTPTSPTKRNPEPSSRPRTKAPCTRNEPTTSIHDCGYDTWYYLRLDRHVRLRQGQALHHPARRLPHELTPPPAVQPRLLQRRHDSHQPRHGLSRESISDLQVWKNAEIDEQ